MSRVDKSWCPTASLSTLKRRSELLWQLRNFFRAQGFIEVQTPLLSADTVVDRYIDPIEVDPTSLGLGHSAVTPFYLQTSPEFAMKRLMAYGAEAIYQIGPAFRGGERGRYHNPEFTMLEWYRAGDDLKQAIDFLARLVLMLLPDSRPIIRSYQEVFEERIGLCPWTSNLGEFEQVCRSHGIVLGSSRGQDRDAWLNILFAELVQPNLGVEQPVIVSHYPASQAALAATCSQDPRVAERFELFIGGVELANGYHELLSPDQLLQRSERNNALRRENGDKELPTVSRLVEAMRCGLPDCSGCALGVDRLLMVLMGAESIDEVICFPIERA